MMPRRLFVPLLGLLLLATGNAHARSFGDILRALGSLRICGNAIVDVSSDRANCGDCGSNDPTTFVCTQDQVCCSGHCVNLHDNCGGCGAQFTCANNEQCCPQAGYGLPSFECADTTINALFCGASCQRCPLIERFDSTDTLVGCCSLKGGGTCVMDAADFQSDPLNCGDCHHNCFDDPNRNWLCSHGHCCPYCTQWLDAGPDGPNCYSCDALNRLAGTTLKCCHDYDHCRDIGSDPENCGEACTDCAAASTAGQECIYGKCMCPPERPDVCDSQCMNLWDLHGKYCGTCGNVCYSSSACCISPDGFRPYCSTTYFDIDPQNCGGCGRVCPPGLGCSGGSCAATNPR